VEVKADELEPVDEFEMELALVCGIYQPIRYRLRAFGQIYEWPVDVATRRSSKPTPTKTPLHAEARVRPRPSQDQAGRALGCLTGRRRA